MKIVIVGAGEVGFHVASRLSLENKDVVVIDKQAEALRRVSENLDVQTILGCGSSPVILEQAGIREADVLLAVTDTDETNLVASLFANILSPTTIKLARIRSKDYLLYQDTLKHAPYHLDVIINPEDEAVKAVERLLNIPGAVDVGEFADGRIKLVGVRLEKDCPVAGTRLAELQDKSSKKILVAAILRDEKLIIPSGEDQLQERDLIYFVSAEKELEEALQLFGKGAEPFKRVLLIGGGNLGLKLAKALERHPIHIKLIEKDPDRCKELVKALDKVVVLQGDGSDEDLLHEENVKDMDVFVTLTESEETNILASLLAKRMGANKTITRISKSSYLPLASAIGLEHVVSSRLAAVNTILQYVREGKVLSAMTLKGEEAETLEVIAPEASDIVGKPLKQIRFPRGALVVAIIRKEEVTIPSGESIILPQDRIIIFCTRHSIPWVEKALVVKLEHV